MPARPLDPHDDHVLLGRAAAGDLEAFATVYDQHHHRVFRFAYAMTGSRDAAGDVTQDVFVALLDQAGRYDPSRGRLSTYLYGIVRNLCRGRRRHLRRFESIDRDERRDGREDDVTACTTFADPVVEGELAALVRRALAHIPPRYREVIVLCDLHELSYAEAAVVVRSSVAGVRSRLHRGRQQLRLRLAPHVQASSGLPKPARCTP